MKTAEERTRVKSYVLVLVLLCLGSTARFAWESPELAHPIAEDRFDDYLHRFDELKKALPTRGVVGYIDDRAANPLGPGYYYAVQYALAPLVVENSTQAELVIGNFSSPALVGEHPRNLMPVRDFGQGVVLFTQRRP
jgi:hypothetical protein